MSFKIRPVKKSDLDDVLLLARQFPLLSLPPDEYVLRKKIECSEASFLGQVLNDEAVYFFVCEDLETRQIVACSQIKAKKGTPEMPAYSFRVLKKEHFSPDLSIGFIHQLLRLKIDINGPSEIGGLIVDRTYRGRPEKVGKLMSLARFLYIKHHPEKFESTLLSEMAPPLLADGRSEFWEALGRRFTGIPYKEADELTAKNKEFIKNLFPQEDIYVCLLDAKARLALAQVGKETLPAIKMLKSIGFTYCFEVDPFDGGPHYVVPKEETSIFKTSFMAPCEFRELNEAEGFGLISVIRDNQFYCVQTPYGKDGENVVLPEKVSETLEIEMGQEVLVYPINN